jgi:hypothetical protein
MTCRLITNLGPTTTTFGVSEPIGESGSVGIILTIDSEDMAVVAGAETTNLTVDRAANDTYAAPHAAGATVTVGTNREAPEQYLDSVTAGTIAASKALVVDANKALKGPLTLYPASAGTDANAGLYIRALNDATSFFTNQAALRSYLLYLNGNRPSTKPLGAGGEGVDDATIRAIYRSYAADGANVQSRCLNVAARADGTTGGSVGNLIGTNVSTATTLSNDEIALSLVNENYAAGTGGVSGGLDVTHLHEGPNATGGEFGIRVRQQKKNGSQTGAVLRAQNDVLGAAHASATFWKYGLDLSGIAATAANVSDGLAAAEGVSTAKGDIVFGSKDANGLPTIFATGAATTDAGIVTQVGADALWADGSMYVSVVDGGGLIFQKRNDVWVDIVAALEGVTAGTMTAGKAVIPTTGGVIDQLDITSLKVNGVSATASVAQQTVQTVERSFVETIGAGTYTGTVVVPAGATVKDVAWRNTALWTASVSASLVVGDDDDANGYIEATDVKAAPLADVNGAGAGFSSQLTLGATLGVYKGGAGKYCAAQKTITATVTTVDVATGNTGRSRLLVTYAIPTTAAATKA